MGQWGSEAEQEKWQTHANITSTCSILQVLFQLQLDVQICANRYRCAGGCQMADSARM